MEQAELFEPTPRVTMLEFTGKGRRDAHWHAADILIFTKATRLNMTPDLMEQIQEMETTEKLKELEAMSKTIPSSWEFVDMTFLIEDVTRACAQQITRTRTGSYAMQSQRVVDVSGASVRNPATDPEKRETFAREAASAIDGYARLVQKGFALQDARGVLPINIKCNLVAKYNLRSFVDLVLARESLRTQDEYSEIVHQMKTQVITQWSWARTFFEPKHEKAIQILEKAVKELGITTGNGVAWEIAKAIDLIRKG